MDKKTLKLFEDIKKLIVLDLITQGVQSKDIAKVLRVHKSTITRLAPSRKLRESKKNVTFSQEIVLRPLVKISKKPSHWSNKWWVQWFVVILGLGTASQVLGTFFANLLRIIP